MKPTSPDGVIGTGRTRLVTFDEEMLVMAIEGKSQDLGARLGVEVPDEFLDETKLLAMRLEQIREDPSYLPWSVRAIIDDVRHCLVGHINFHTMPGADYLMALAPEGVEVGYTIFPSYRRQGYAIEALRGVLRWASERYGVPYFVASVSPDNAPSVQLVNKVGFIAVGEHWDEVDGREIVYVLTGEPLQRFLMLKLS